MSKSMISAEMQQNMNAIMGAGRRGVVMPVMPGMMYGPGLDAAGAASGMAFLVAELEKQDTRLLEPLTSITGPRDITMKPGGGWVSNTSNVFVDYGTTGQDEDNIIGSETTNIPVAQANISKDVFVVNTFAEILRVPLFDDLKLQQVGRSLNQILDDGLRLNYNKSLDKSIYNGLSKAHTYGLVNNPAVTAAAVPNGAGGQAAWNKKTPAEIQTDINNILTATWAASEYDLTGMATQILIPPSQYAYLVNTPVSSIAQISILEYLLQNNIAKNQGRSLQIFPCRWCIGAGTGATDRMVGYVNAENRVCMDLTVPLSRVLTAPNVGSGSYETLYAAQFGQVKFLYLQCVRYADGI